MAWNRAGRVYFQARMAPIFTQSSKQFSTNSGGFGEGKDGFSFEKLDVLTKKFMKEVDDMNKEEEKFNKELQTMIIHGESGAGLVKVSLRGTGEMDKLTIDPALIPAGDNNVAKHLQLIEDLVVAAHSNAFQALKAKIPQQPKHNPLEMIKKMYKDYGFTNNPFSGNPFSGFPFPPGFGGFPNKK